jgi:hypothetical protein
MQLKASEHQRLSLGRLQNEHLQAMTRSEAIVFPLFVSGAYGGAMAKCFQCLQWIQLRSCR